MNKLNLGIYVLTALALIGVVVLAVLKLDTSILVPVLTALIGVIVGKQGGAVIGALGKKFGKK